MALSIEEILFDAEERMEKAVNVYRNELRGLRTGRATPALVDSIRVEYYGSQTPIKQVANIGAPEPNLIVIRPFDPSVLKQIAKSILASELGLTPQNDGKVIRLSIPALSGERRKQLVSRVKELAEETRIAIRNIRRDANKQTDLAQKEKLISEDDRDGTKQEIQDLTKKYESQTNELADKKAQEVLDE